MLVSHMLYRTAQSSKVHRTESVLVMGHERTMGVSSTGSDQKQQNIFIFVCISLFYYVALQDHHMQRNGGDHDWLIPTPVSTVRLVQPSKIYSIVLLTYSLTRSLAVPDKLPDAINKQCDNWPIVMSCAINRR